MNIYISDFISDKILIKKRKYLMPLFICIFLELISVTIITISAYLSDNNSMSDTKISNKRSKQNISLLLLIFALILNSAGLITLINPVGLCL